MQRVALIDYGAGNLRSVERALMRAGAAVVVTNAPEDILSADRIVLPGQGAFGACMQGLIAQPGVIEALEEKVRRRGAPFLGVCVGMQLLAETGLEHGETQGLNWIGGACAALDPGPGRVLPHTGWNTAAPIRAHPVLDALAPAAHVYFNHSFALDPPADAIAAVTEHGVRFAAAVARDTLVGVQFHPEKSQAAGIALLQRFLAWSP